MGGGGTSVAQTAAPREGDTSARSATRAVTWPPRGAWRGLLVGRRARRDPDTAPSPPADAGARETWSGGESVRRIPPGRCLGDSGGGNASRARPSDSVAPLGGGGASAAGGRGCSPGVRVQPRPGPPENCRPPTADQAASAPRPRARETPRGRPAPVSTASGSASSLGSEPREPAARRVPSDRWRVPWQLGSRSPEAGRRGSRARPRSRGTPRRTAARTPSPSRSPRMACGRPGCPVTRRAPPWGAASKGNEGIPRLL